MLTDFPDCFSRLLGCITCFDATAGFFVAGTGLACTGFGGAAFGAGFATGLTVFATGLFAPFFASATFATTTGRFAFAATFDGALRALLAPACATVLLRAGAFAFLALLAGAGLLFAIPASTLRFGGRVL
ncbi:MAG TPA: hypothetical protein VFV97_12355 [Rhodanobacteraceae bacterium]|nr:hypothetical protein [Rhodanobacteraceae bacterium]